MLCVVLSVPCKSLQVLLRDKAAGMPTLQCNFTAQGTYSAYSAIHTAWGKCISSQNSDTVILEEDPQGINGTSDLVVTVWASSRILELADMFVALAIKNTPCSTISFISKLGMQLKLFSARLDDKEHVQLLPYCPSLASEEPLTIPTTVTQFADPTPDSSSISITVGVSPGNGPRNVASFTAHVDVGSPAERGALLSRADVLVMQIAPCTMKISFSSYHHTISYPYPIRGSQHKLRIARKSHYVKVIVPVSEPLDLGGYHLNCTPILQTNAYSRWNIHHICVDRMPMLNLKVPKKIDWLNSHTALQLSDRERGIRNGDAVTKSAPANVLVNVKNSIHALMMISSSVQGKKSHGFGLCDLNQGGIYAILLVGSLRLDVASFTVILNTALIPLSEDRMPAMLPGIQTLQKANPVVEIGILRHEVTAWKKLLPAYAERCRTWTHKANCEYAAQNKIPLSCEIDQNPICTCGEGFGFDGPEWKVPSWKKLLPFATRVAISPLFSVSYIETWGSNK
ncbi:hypothetical protein FRC06_010300 [Ceratobasidium sp. 370]|nr:hypothetical protein FRC06_010300 [Ceratobasidium sp. 370]